MNRLEPGQLWVMRIQGIIVALVIAALATGAEAALAAKNAPSFLVATPALLLIAYLVFISPGRHFRAWGYAMDGQELQVRHGVLVQVQTIVPLDRVQHIDLSQGPLERAFGVCRLIVHTAGTQHSRVVLPGLSRSDAERMRDEIRARIRTEAE